MPCHWEKTNDLKMYCSDTYPKCSPGRTAGDNSASYGQHFCSCVKVLFIVSHFKASEYRQVWMHFRSK